MSTSRPPHSRARVRASSRSERRSGARSRTSSRAALSSTRPRDEAEHDRRSSLSSSTRTRDEAARDRRSSLPTSTLSRDEVERDRRSSLVDEIAYGRAVAALHELGGWLFDLAAHAVEDWPDARQRVRSARRYILSKLRGREPRDIAAEDLAFSARLLARLLASDLDLGASEVVTILDEIGLPTDEVPIVPTTAREHVARVPAAPITPLASRRPSPLEDPQRSGDVCETCGHRRLPFRNAA